MSRSDQYQMTQHDLTYLPSEAGYGESPDTLETYQQRYSASQNDLASSNSYISHSPSGWKSSGHEIVSKLRASVLGVLTSLAHETVIKGGSKRSDRMRCRVSLLYSNP